MCHGFSLPLEIVISVSSDEILLGGALARGGIRTLLRRCALADEK